MADYTIVNDRTKHLDLPLPHQGNELQDDLPRLRESFKKIDSAAATLEEKKATRDELTAEAQARAEGDTALARRIIEEIEAREASHQALHNYISAENVARVEADEAEAQARASMMQTHEEDAGAHIPLIRRITAGDISPVIGICQVESGNYTGLWYHTDENGQPVTPNKRFFDFHPIYNGMRRVLVDGQVMVEIPAFWFKHFVIESGPFAGKWCKVISPEPREGFKLYPAFYSPSGAALEKIYIAAYQATNEGGNPLMLGSRPGKTPYVNTTLANMAKYCENRNVDGVTGFHMWNIYEYNALCLLFLIEFAHTDSQAEMGRGWVDSTAAVVVDEERQCKWRGFYGLFGNVWQFVDGLRLKGNRQIEIFKNDGSLEWVNTELICPSYDGTNSTRITALHTAKGEGFDANELFLPAAHSTNSSLGMFPDNFWGGSGSAGNILIIGGAYHNGSGAGLFCLYLTYAAGWSHANGGCRSAKW